MSEMLPNPEHYFREFLPQRDQLLHDLEREAHMEGIPIVGPVVGELLFILARVPGRSTSWNWAPPPATPPSTWPGVRARRRPGTHPGDG